jgi:hypothetical protein
MLLTILENMKSYIEKSEARGTNPRHTLKWIHFFLNETMENSKISMADLKEKNKKQQEAQNAKRKV